MDFSGDVTCYYFSPKPKYTDLYPHFCTSGGLETLAKLWKTRTFPHSPQGFPQPFSTGKTLWIFIVS